VKKNLKGEVGVFSILITTAIILLLFFPIIAFLFEKARLGVIVGHVEGTIDSAIVESYHSLQMPFLSKEEFRADNGLFQFYVEEKIKSNLNLGNDFSPQDGSILDGPFTLNSLLFVDSSILPYTDITTGIIYERPFVELNFTIRTKPLLYQRIILNALGSEYKEFTAVRKVTLPVNN